MRENSPGGRRLAEILRATSASDDLSDSEDEKEREAWRRGAIEISLSVELRSELEGALKGRPEPTHKELDNFLKEMKTLDSDSLFRPSLRHLARKLPPFPPGKQPILNSVQQKKVLVEVARLSSSVSRKDAYRKVAKKYGVYWRTIQNLSIRTYRQGQKEA